VAGAVNSNYIANDVTINFADGSASTPSITNNGDTNTGIFFPAADSIGFTEGGAEIARFDSSGNLLVGTTSASGFDSGADNIILGGGSGNTGMTIYSGTTGVGAINFADGTSGSAIYAGGITYNHNDNRMDFSTTDGSSRMRIDSAGRIYFYSLAASAGTNALRWSTSTGQVTYDTSSARYKDNIRDSVYGLNHVMQMRSAQFEYKDDGRSDVGFIAEEMQSIVPELVGLDKDGQADSVSYDRMVSVLVKAIQELKAEVDLLKAEVTALKGTE
jgi:hypothetical protein